MSEYIYPYPDPVVEITGVQELARDLVVVPDRRVPLVPNIGVIGGTHSVLVVETGLGPGNAGKVLKFAADYAQGRRLYLTTTHFHPEHAFGAQVFAGEATYLINRVQAEDLAAKGPGYLEQFRGFGGAVARELEGVKLPTPDVVYDDSYDLDLGGRTVQLRPAGRAHTKGDQVVTVPRRRGPVHRRSGGDRAVRDLPVVPALRHRRVRDPLDRVNEASGGRQPAGSGPRARRRRRRATAGRRPRLP